MKAYKKVVLSILAIIGCAVLIALPSGIKILREKGMEGVFKRKRAYFDKVLPEASPVVDEAEKTSKKMGLQ